MSELPRRSLWAWGYADKLPDAAARAGLCALVRALLPHAAPQVLPLPPDEPDVPPPRLRPPPALADLCSQAPRDRAAHRRGRSYPDLVAGFGGDYSGAPELVVRPRTADDVERVLAECHAQRLAVVPFGGGTSVVGGVDSDAARGGHPGVVSLDLSRLSGLLELDETSRLARLGAGTSGPEIEAALAPHGLTLRFFPQSFQHSTLGGWLATRAAGHYATGPTHIDDLCHSVAMVAPQGRVETHRHPASGAGPEPLRLLVGSEGAFGVITDAWMRVAPKPVHRSSASVRFASFFDGVAAARALAQSGLAPANARLLDGEEARLFRVAFDGSSVLLVGFESAVAPTAPALARALELCADHRGAVHGEPRHGGPGTGRGAAADAESWRAAFLDAPYLQSALVSIGVLCDTFETACTWTAFPALHAAVLGAVQGALARECGGGLVSCRFTHVYPDGPAPYYTFLAPAPYGREVEAWRVVKEAACAALAAHGGTITHHHAVGRTHVAGYRREVTRSWSVGLAALKRAWDPDGVMNPGVLGL